MSKFVTRLMAALCLALILTPLAQAGVIAPPSNLANSHIGAVNLDPLLINKTRVCVSKSRSNLAPCNLAFVGDSKTAGTVGGSGGGTTSTFSSYPFYVYLELQKEGFAVRYDTFVPGNAGDSRITVGAGWTLFSNYLWQNPGNLTSSLTFAPTDSIDTCDIYYQDPAGAAGSLQWNFNGAANTTVAMTGSATLKKTTATVTAGTTNILNVFASAGGIAVVNCFNSTVNDIRIMNLADGGVSASGVNGGQYFSTKNVWAFVAASMYYVDLGTNDWGSQNPAAYFTNMSGIYSTLSAISPTILEVPVQAGTSTDANKLAYRAQLYALAGGSIPLVDTGLRYGVTNTAATANGWVNDALHPFQFTYEDQGRWIAHLLLTQP